MWRFVLCKILSILNRLQGEIIRPTLFLSRQRTYQGPCLQAEPSFEYLDRSARPEAKLIREEYDRWFRAFPLKHRSELRGRFQSSNDVEHLAAAFELYMHALIAGLGSCLEVHPQLPNNKLTHPDFLVIESNGYSYYLEATLATDKSREDVVAESRKNPVIDAINSLSENSFYLFVSEKGEPRNTVSIKKIVSSITAWLNTLDVDQLYQEYESTGLNSMPSEDFGQHGWELRLTAIPRSPSRRTIYANRKIISWNFGAKWLGTWQSIRTKVVAKNGHYGDLDKPLVTAINVGQPFLDQRDEVQALFGQEQVRINMDDPSAAPRQGRAPNGAWISGTGPQCTRTSACILCGDVTPWTAGVRTVTVYLNPWAKLNCKGSLLELAHARVDDETLVFNTGRQPAEILKLPENWPES